MHVLLLHLPKIPQQLATQKTHMLIGIMGKMGAGKTYSMSVLASYMARATRAPLWANYKLKGAGDIHSLNDVTEKTSGILCFDEIWLSADARAWKDNVRLTQWVNQTRKKKMIVFYTTQHIRQVEMRIRNGTDVLIYCDKIPDGNGGYQSWLQFIDWQYRQMGRKYLMPHKKEFYDLYDTYEVLKPLTFGGKSSTGSNKWQKGGKKQWNAPDKYGWEDDEKEFKF